MSKKGGQSDDDEEVLDEGDEESSKPNPDSLELPKIDGIPADIETDFQVYQCKNAISILRDRYPKELKEIYASLREFKLKRSDILLPGGNRSTVSKALDSAFYKRNWIEIEFKTQFQFLAFKRIRNKDESKTKKKGEVVAREPLFSESYKTPTHSVDCFKSKIALEIEWSNKDPFFDRDLNNFRLLYDLRAVDVGIIITKSDLLMDEMKKNQQVWKKFGNSTTWFGKLKTRMDGGGAGGCPVFVFAIKPEKIEIDVADEDVDAFIDASKKARQARRDAVKKAKPKA